MKIIAACAMVTWAMASFDTKAELWTFVDERGVTHFASSQLDPRYASFAASHAKPQVGNAKADSLGGAAPAAASATLATAPPSSLVLSTYIAGMPGFSEARHHLKAASEVYGVDEVLLQALVATESGFDAKAVSPKGAVGLMQVMPATAARYGLTVNAPAEAGDDPATEKLKDPSVNVNLGTRYLRDLLRLFSGNRSLALAAYNAGEGAVRKAGNRIPDFKETQNYVKTVLQLVEGLGQPAHGSPGQTAKGISRVQTLVNKPQTAGVQMITDRASAQAGAAVSVKLP